jgi:uncharacterized membrane protein
MQQTIKQTALVILVLFLTSFSGQAQSESHSTNWNDIGQLGAIAAILTVLNYFLEKDVEKFGEQVESAQGAG